MHRVLPFALAAALLASAPALAQTPPAVRDVFQTTSGQAIEAERGVIQVPENRADPASRQIPLAWMRLRSTAERPGAPIVYLAGGPGGSGLSTLEGPRQPVFLALLEVADVIVFDQRGVGESDAIPPCSAAAPFDLSQPLTEATYSAYYAGTLASCAVFWRDQDVDLAGYSTPEAADDVADLAAALGAARVNLMGISYGTHLAFSILRRHPDLVERVVLASVEGPDQTVKLPGAIDQAFARIDAATPDADIVALMRRVHTAWSEPRPLTVGGPDGASATFHADAFILRMMAGYMAKNPDGLSDLAMFYGALDQGTANAVAPYIFGAFLAEPLTLDGMPEATDLASGISDARLALVMQQAPDSLIGSVANFPMPQLAHVLPGQDLGDDFRAPVRWDGPALILSGDLDVRTPLEEQALAVAHLGDRHTIVVRNGGHDLFEAHPAVPALLVDFFSGRPVIVTELDLPSPLMTRP